jgi:hypothetical protein
MMPGRVLQAAGLVEAADAPRPKGSLFSLPSGWSFLFTLEFGFPTPDRMAALSAEGTALAVSADERSMFSVVRGYERGKAGFVIEHDGGQHGPRHVATAGALPAEWAPILTRLTRQQDEEDRSAAEVDFIFDAPVELAFALCGYRHDKPWPKGQQPESTLFVERKGSGLLGRLFGRR